MRIIVGSSTKKTKEIKTERIVDLGAIKSGVPTNVSQYGAAGSDIKELETAKNFASEAEKSAKEASSSAGKAEDFYELTKDAALGVQDNTDDSFKYLEEIRATSIKIGEQEVNIDEAEKQVILHTTAVENAAQIASDSATSARASEANSTASASSASVSAATSSTKAKEASTSATHAANSALAASNSAAAALISERAAKTSETNSKASKDASALSASAANISEGIATTAKNQANISATTAANSVTAALTAKTQAETSAMSAANSASAALASKNATATSATNAAGSAATASTKAGEASSSASSALASKNAAALSNTSATASKVASKASEDAAKVSELAAYASELGSSASAVGADASESAAKTSEVNSIANATASYNYSELARGYANAAEISKGESQTSAENADNSADESLLSANAAKASELIAKASEVASKVSETAAKASATASKASELAAKASETTANTKAVQTAANAVTTAGHVTQTANNAALAETAKKVAEAAASAIVGGIVDKGAWNASTGVFPEKPTRSLPEGGTALVSGFWKVTVAGTAGGISFLAGDDLRFSAGTDTFYKIDNTDAVASVQGKTGAVTLIASEVGALATPTGTHAVDTVLVAGATAGTSKHSGFTLGKSVPSNAVFTDTVYTHPTNDGNLHIPATGTTNSGKALVAGATAGSAAWKTLTSADISGLGAALNTKLAATANAVSATKLQNPVTVNGVAFDGSANITISASNPATLTRGTGLTGADYNGASATTWAVAYGTAAGTACQGNDARLSDARTPLAHSHVWADVTGKPTTLAGYGITDAPTKTGSGASGSWSINVTGNAASATFLQTARTLTIGATGKSFNGSGNASWSLAEIGAAPTSHSHASITSNYTNWVGNTEAATVGSLAWRNYGNNHVIFDASKSLTPSGTACNNTNPHNNWSPSYPTLMGFNGEGTYGVRVDTARNAERLNNLDLHSDRNNEANKVVRTDANGYLNVGWLHTISGATSTGTLFACFNNTSDMYLRYMTAEQTRSAIGAQPAGSYAAASHTHTITDITSLQTSLDAKQEIDTQKGAIVASRYLTGGISAVGTKIRLPFSTNAGTMVCFTVRVYQNYQTTDVLFSGYLYSGTNQWHDPKAVVSAGSTGLNVKMGRDADGRAYVWLQGGDYRGVAVLDVVGGYAAANWNTGWEISESDTAPNVALDTRIYPPYSPNNKPTPADIGAQPSGSYAAASHTHDYAPSVSATLLGNDSTVAYGRQGLQVSNFAGVGGTGANGTQLQNPTDGWYHHITLNHPNAGGYYVDIAAGFHNNMLAFRPVIAGANQGWNYVYHTNNKPTAADVGAAPTNHTHSYAPLTGAGTSGTWPINVTGTSGGTTGNAATATVLQTARAINGVSFNGSANITVYDSSKLSLSGGVLTGNLEGRRFTGTGTGNDYHIGAFEARGNGATNTVYPTIGFHQPGLYAGSLQMRAGGDFSFYSQGETVLGTVRAATFVGALSGNSATATTLQTARTLTIGSTGKSFNGSANVAWSLAEIGAQPAGSYAASSHTHDWSQVTGQPVTATRWPTFAEVTGKPTTFAPSSHTHPVSQVTGLGNAATKNVGTAVGDLLEANSSYFGVQSSSDFPDGTLIRTSLPATATGPSITLKLWGKGYGGLPHLIMVEAYQYEGSWYSTSWINLSGNITNVTIMEFGGYVCFWFATTGYWSSFFVEAYDTRGGGIPANMVTSVVNSAKPAGTKVVDIPLTVTYNTSNIPVTATRWPTLAEVSGKPADYPTTWAEVAAKPATATRWPTPAEVGLGNVVNKGWNYGAIGDTYAVRDGNGDLVARQLHGTHVGDGSNLFNLQWARLVGAPVTALRWPTLAEIGAASAAHSHHATQIKDLNLSTVAESKKLIFSHDAYNVGSLLDVTYGQIQGKMVTFVGLSNDYLMSSTIYVPTFAELPSVGRNKLVLGLFSSASVVFDATTTSGKMKPIDTHIRRIYVHN